jgi:hypothetical protein
MYDKTAEDIQSGTGLGAEGRRYPSANSVFLGFLGKSEIPAYRVLHRHSEVDTIGIDAGSHHDARTGDRLRMSARPTPHHVASNVTRGPLAHARATLAAPRSGTNTSADASLVRRFIEAGDVCGENW